MSPGVSRLALTTRGSWSRAVNSSTSSRGSSSPLHPQGVVGQLLHPQQDDTAVGVGKGGIGLPDAPGQPAGGQLGLQAVVFPVTADLLEVKHGMSPSF